MLGLSTECLESISYTVSKSLYRINRILGHRLTVYATKKQTGKFMLQMMCYKDTQTGKFVLQRHKLKGYATISIRNGIRFKHPEGDPLRRFAYKMVCGLPLTRHTRLSNPQEILRLNSIWI